MSKRRQWPKVKKSINHGKEVYVVDARIKGKGERKFFDTLKEAEGWRDQQRVKRENEGGKAFNDSELAAYGWNIQDAVRFALAHLRQQAESKPVGDAAAALVEFKRGRVGETRLSDIENRLARFTEACGEKTR